MTNPEIERLLRLQRSAYELLLRLQRSAYELLLWINQRAASEQELLSGENLEKWRYARSCETWVRDIHGMIPTAIRPSEEEIPAFARLYSSFFQTSFRLAESTAVQLPEHRGSRWGWRQTGRRKLVAGAPGGKKTQGGKAKLEEAARELRLIALEELALEHDLLLGPRELEALDCDAALARAVTLWTYVHELNRRANFASQGEAVRLLWGAMDKKERAKLDVERVLRARDTILKAAQAMDKNDR